MERIIIEKFNKGNLNVWFYIDTLRYYNSSQELLEKEDSFICYYKFTEPFLFCIGEIIKDQNDKIVIFNTAQNALVGGLNYVKHKFNLEN